MTRLSTVFSSMAVFFLLGLALSDGCSPEPVRGTAVTDLFNAPALTGRGHIVVEGGRALISIEHLASPKQGTDGEAIAPNGLYSTTVLDRPAAGLKASLEANACVKSDNRAPGFPAYSGASPCP